MSDAPSAAADGQPISVSAWLYLTLCFAAVALVFWRPDGLVHAAAVLTVAYLALEFRRTSPVQRTVGYLLAAGGVALGLAAGDGLQVFLDGVARSLKFLLVFFAVAWLQYPAQTSPSLIAARQFVLDQPAGRRFSILAFAAHGLGAFLNLAALTLLSDMVTRAQGRRLKDRLAVALMVGFTAASAWSPFYVSVTVVLAAFPGMKWTDVAVPGIIIGFSVVALTALVDRLIARRGGPKPSVPPSQVPGNWGRLILLLGSLMACVVTLETVFHLSIPVVLAMLSPPYALLWLLISRDRRADAAGLPARVVASLPGLRGEALIFVGANLFGTGISAVLDPAQAADVLHIALWPDWVKPPALALFIIAAGAVGLHPVVLVIIIGTALPPEVFGMPPVVMALVMLGTWGLSTTSSPFSGTTLIVGRLTGENSFRLAWTSAPLYTVLGALLVSLVAWAVWRTGWFI